MNLFKKTVLLACMACLTMGAVGCGNTQDAQPKTETTLSDTEMMSDDTAMEGTIKPSDYVFPTMETYDFPYLGLNFSIPQSVRDAMDAKTMAMNIDEMPNEDGTPRYGVAHWSLMNDAQREAEVSMKGNGYFDWMDSLKRLAAIGMYDSTIDNEELNKITGCDSHEEIGKSADGKYIYYRSKNSAEETMAFGEMTASVKEKMDLPQGGSLFMQPGDFAQPSNMTSIKGVTLESLNGEPFTDQDFAKNDITMVNVFATWCSPCIQEIPDLEAAYQEMKDKGLGMVGILDDAVKPEGDGFVPNEEGIELGKVIQEKTKATYPFLKPDETRLNGRLEGINALPETFFVDKEGNIVGETYSGSRSKEEWLQIMEKELANVKGSAQ